MTSSGFALSAHNSDLVKKFQGNGWALTCSPASQNELSAILDDKVSESCNAPKPSETPDPPQPEYLPDWADIVFKRSEGWRAEDGFAPLWLAKATERSEFALFQLPAPDHRWVVKFAGKILEPFDFRKEGWKELHEIMAYGHVLDRADLILSSSQARAANDALKSVGLITAANDQEYTEEDINSSVTGARLKGFDTQTSDGKIKPDLWETCADDFSSQLRDRLNRVFNTIARKDELAAAMIRQAVRSRNGRFSFNDSVEWMTSLGEIPFDASMTFKGKDWEIDIPNSSATLVVPDSAGIRAIARILMSNNIACPCALIADGELLTEFLGRPRHHKYFEAIHRRPRVKYSDPENGEVERAICAAMRLKSDWCYVADHVIGEQSELHTVCQLPIGKVTLARADALEGVRDLIKKQQAKMFFCHEPSQQFKRILADIETGIDFARKQEKLLEQVQPKSVEYRSRVQKAIHRAQTDLPTMGDWTTRYDFLADHFVQNIRGGIVFQYTGPYRWKIEGIAEIPDILDLAADHVQFKAIKIAKLKRKASRKTKAIQALKSMGASAS